MKEELEMFEFDKYDETKLKPEDHYIFWQNKELNRITYKYNRPLKYFWYILTNNTKMLNNIQMGRIKK